jgi:hypothetical protein
MAAARTFFRLENEQRCLVQYRESLRCDKSGRNVMCDLRCRIHTVSTIFKMLLRHYLLTISY